MEVEIDYNTEAMVCQYPNMIFLRYTYEKGNGAVALRMKCPKCNSSLLVFEPFIHTFSPLARSAFTSKCKVRKRGTFSEVMGISTVATVDSGCRPENPPTFEKVGSKLSTCDSPFNSLTEFPPRCSGRIRGCRDPAAEEGPVQPSRLPHRPEWCATVQCCSGCIYRSGEW